VTELSALVLALTPEPFLAEWNLWVLRGLFRLLPHSGMRDMVAQFLIFNAVASRWVYAGVFYAYWRIEDERTVWRRVQLLTISIALCVVILATLLVRPWVGWPAPTLAPHFRYLFPQYLWNGGNSNCFPSHSTLIYVLVAIGV
jgi:hypothetical protein